MLKIPPAKVVLPGLEALQQGYSSSTSTAKVVPPRLPPAKAPSAPSLSYKPDWTCTSCGDIQFAKNTACRMCGAARPDFPQLVQPPPPAKAPAVQVAPIHEPEWVCTSCGDLQFAKNSACRMCGTARQDFQQDVPDIAPPPPPQLPHIPGINECTIFVGNITESGLNDGLPELLAGAGEVVRWHVAGNKFVGGIFCEYKSKEAAVTAMSVLQGSVLDGNRIFSTDAHMALRLLPCLRPELPIPPPPAGAPPPPAPPPAIPPPPPGAPPEFLNELKAKMAELSGTTSHICKHGFKCLQVECRDRHPEGRKIEEQPESLICRFKRNCKRKDCFYVHPGGRQIDEDPSKGMCRLGAQCDKPGCLYSHPDDRDRVSFHICDYCKERGHLRKACPHRGSNCLKADAFPEHWRAEGALALADRLASQLQKFGDLLDTPEISEDCSSATAYFVSAEVARDAVQRVFSAENSLEFSLKFSPNANHTAKRCEHSIFIGNLSAEATEEEVRKMCEEVGVVLSVRVQKHRNGAGYFAFCDFHDECTQQAALVVLDGKELHGRLLRVDAGQKETQCAVVSGFSEDWSCFEQEELGQRVKDLVESFGELEATPEVLEEGRKVRVQFKNRPLTSTTSLEIEGTVLTITPCFTPVHSQVRYRRSRECRECSIFIGNLAFSVSDDDLHRICSEVGAVEEAHVARNKETEAPMGYGFCKFTSRDSVEDAIKKLNNAELHGSRLRVSARDRSRSRSPQSKLPMASSRSRSPRGRRKERRRDGQEMLVIHIDELEMPLRPSMEPSPTDCEVWLPMMMDENSDDWVGKFGDVDEVFRVSEIEHGATLEKGYVKFSLHASAMDCVESGIASWSESERIIASQNARDRGTSSYSVNMMSRFFSNRGKLLNDLKDKLGVNYLSLRGDGVGNNRSDRVSSRLHFLCRGSRDILGKLRTSLEELVMDVHNDYSNTSAGHTDGIADTIFIDIYVDDLDMPSRPKVQPSPLEREVWLDSLPEEDNEDWVSKFGEVDEVFRIDDKEIGIAVHRGYVKFKSHEAARRCVQAGVASWSESERILRSEKSTNEQRVYRKNVIAMLLGNRGERIVAAKEEIGLRMLSLRADGIGDHQSNAGSRLHFACRGAPDTVANARPVLEKMLGDIHTELSDFLASAPEPNQRKKKFSDTVFRPKEGKKKRRKQKLQHSRLDQHSFDPPPPFLHVPLMVPPPPHVPQMVPPSPDVPHMVPPQPPGTDWNYRRSPAPPSAPPPASLLPPPHDMFASALSHHIRERSSPLPRSPFGVALPSGSGMHPLPPPPPGMFPPSEMVAKDALDDLLCFSDDEALSSEEPVLEREGPPPKMLLPSSKAPSVAHQQSPSKTSPGKAMPSKQNPSTPKPSKHNPSTPMPSKQNPGKAMPSKQAPTRKPIVAPSPKATLPKATPKRRPDTVPKPSSSAKFPTPSSAKVPPAIFKPPASKAVFKPPVSKARPSEPARNAFPVPSVAAKPVSRPDHLKKSVFRPSRSSST